MHQAIACALVATPALACIATSIWCNSNSTSYTTATISRSKRALSSKLTAREPDQLSSAPTHHPAQAECAKL